MHKEGFLHSYTEHDKTFKENTLGTDFWYYGKHALLMGVKDWKHIFSARLALLYFDFLKGQKCKWIIQSIAK